MVVPALKMDKEVKRIEPGNWKEMVTQLAATVLLVFDAVHMWLTFALTVGAPFRLLLNDIVAAVGVQVVATVVVSDAALLAGLLSTRGVPPKSTAETEAPTVT